MLIHNFATHRKPKRTKAVEFGILSPAEIRRMAVCEIKNPLIYCRGLPMCEGVIDHRLGPCDRRVKCGTCNLSVQECPGHCGFIDLGVPMYHGFTDTCMKILRSVCYFCSHLLGGEDDHVQNPTLRGKSLFLSVYNNARTKKCCAHCGAPQPTYNRATAGGVIHLVWPTDTPWDDPKEKAEVTARMFTSIEAASILRYIPEEHVVAMGFDPQRNHPAWMVPDVLLVPPSSTRPAIMSSSGSRLRGQDDLTLKLNDINKRAAELRGYMDAHNWSIVDPVTPEMADKMQKLQIEIFTMLSNSPSTQRSASTLQRQGATMKSMAQRLRGKEGRIRGNLMGKRVDFSARSVITPDSLMAVGDVGVPMAIAHELTLPERVTSHNIERLYKRVMIGAHDVAGAQSVATKQGIVQLAFLDASQRADLRLQFGDTVERFLDNGDMCIFNRQPSLHRIGFLGHKVKLYPGRTFRLNLSVTSPYNADFDGDEMNLHACQSVNAQTEIANLMSVGQQIITPQSAKPVMGIVQDSCVGAFLMTDPQVLLTRSQLMRLVVWVRRTDGNIPPLPPPAIESPGPYWTGAQAFSLVLPDGLVIDRMSVQDSWPTDNVCIRGGQLLYGQLSKAILGTSGGGVIDVLYREFGAEITMDYMSNEQRIVVPFLMSRGFSVSFRDAVVTPEGREKVSAHIASARQNIEAIVNADLPESVRAMAEGTVFSMLSKLLLQAGAIGKRYMLPESSIAALVESGSKGNQLNIAQIAGTVGQQAVEGQRIFSAASDRTLTCFDHGSTELLANGFVESSYCTGLSPAEFFFHAMGGREGLVDTAVKTAHTGYIQRRMMKALEDIHSTYDGTVRNAQGMVVQFAYGLDAWDPTLVRESRIQALGCTAAQLRTDICDDPPTQRQLAELRHLREAVDAAREARYCVLRPAMDTRTLLPFAVDQLFNRFGNTVPDGAPDADAMASDANTARMCIDTLCHRLQTTQPASRSNVVVAIRHQLCSKALCSAGVTGARIAELFRFVEDRCLESLVSPGDACGSICAQSLGEPTTQMTLNTFHHSGIASKGMTQGVPRLKEIIDASHSPKTPVTTLWLHKPLCYDASFVARFARTLPSIKMRSLVRDMSIVYDPDVTRTTVEADTTIVAMDAFFHTAVATSSVYVARLVLYKDEMRSRDLTPPYLQHLLETRMGLKTHVVSSEVNSLEWVLRMRFCHVHEMVRMVSSGTARCDGDNNRLASLATDRSANELEASLVRRVVNIMLDQVVVSGHTGISGAYEREVQAWNVETEQNETIHVVDVMGSVLGSVALLPVVDATKSTCNDPHEVALHLGIEAAMATIHHEIDAVISFDSSKVEKRHVQLVADHMTHRGFIIPMSRHGMNRPGNESGALVQASFEETADVLMQAATFAQTDPAQGVTYSVMSGEESRIIGTGCFDVLIPEEELAGRAQPSKQRPRRLAKSTMHYSAAHKDEDTTVVGYIDKTLWCFESVGSEDLEANRFGSSSEPPANISSSSSMHHPFLDVELPHDDSGEPIGQAPMTDAMASVSDSMVPLSTERPGDGRLAYDGTTTTKKTRQPPKMYVPSSPRVVT